MFQELISKQEAKEKGLARYFTGKPCKRGHISVRSTIRSECVECRRGNVRKTRAKYPDKYREAVRKCKAKNPDKHHETKRRYVAENRIKLCNDIAMYHIARQLQIPVKEIPPELVAAKLEQLEVYRALRKINQLLKDKTHEEATNNG